jgi:phage terminase large subunit-like protein
MDVLKLFSYGDATYENFIRFVKDYLAPHMKMDFVEEDYYREVYEKQWEHRKVDAQISRGHSKSEMGIWIAVYIAVMQPYNPFYEEAHGRKKRIYSQLLCSSDGTTTDELFDRVKDFFEASDELNEFKPKGMGDDKWNNTKIELTNGSTIYARSIKMKRGLHIDRAWFDDLTTDTSTLSDDETWTFFTGAAMPMTENKIAMIFMAGTPIRLSDIMTRVSKKKSWYHIKKPAIINYDTGEILSPNRFSFKSLMEMKEEIGTPKFEAEYMLNPIDDSTALIKREWIRQCYDPNKKIERHRTHFSEVYLGVDFAFSDRKSADHSVFFVLGKHDGKFQMIDYVRRKGMSAAEQMELIQDMHAIFRFDLIGLEENSIQAVTKEWKQLGLPIKLFHTGNIDEKDKKKPDFSSTISVSKRNLVIRIGTTFENSAISIPYGCPESKIKADQLLQECISWAQEEGKLIELGVHPDIPIALGYALEVASKTSFVFDFTG